MWHISFGLQRSVKCDVSSTMPLHVARLILNILNRRGKGEEEKDDEMDDEKPFGGLLVSVAGLLGGRPGPAWTASGAIAGSEARRGESAKILQQPRMTTAWFCKL